MVYFRQFLEYQKSEIYVLYEIYVFIHIFFKNSDVIIMTSLVHKAQAYVLYVLDFGVVWDDDARAVKISNF